MAPAYEIATLAGGCFWCLEAVFEQLQGVDTVESGYAGGETVNPSYREVCAGTTGHAEVVQIHFDPKVTSFREILEVFFAIHDPTTLNRQGADSGTQYRSAVFYHTTQQLEIAKQTVAELDRAGIWTDPIVTEVTALGKFWPAEDYHQAYYRSNPGQPYCQMVVGPKLAKFQQKFSAKMKPV